MLAVTVDFLAWHEAVSLPGAHSSFPADYGFPVIFPAVTLPFVETCFPVRFRQTQFSRKLFELSECAASFCSRMYERLIEER